MGGQQLGWVGRDRSGWQHIELLDMGVLDRIGPAALAGHDRRQSDPVGYREYLEHRWLAKIGIDQQRFFAFLGISDREVGSRRALALAGIGRSDHDDLDRFIEGRELNVRAQGAVGFRDRRFRLVIGDEAGFTG